MKNTLWMVCAALVALVSCEKQPAELNRVPVTFDLQAAHPDGMGTKAVKAGWEDGDRIFVVFSGVESPHYLIMTYNNGAWDKTQMNDRYEAGLPLNEGDEGTMTAIFLPFAAEETYMYDAGGSFTFSEIYMSYYLTDKKPYTVVNGKVSGFFDMKIPDGFVQFYMDAEDAADGKALLWEPNVMPYAATGVAPEGVMVNYAQTNYGAALPGFKYGDGYIFSGKLAPSAQNEPVTYKFTRFLGKGDAQTATTSTPHTMKASGKKGRAADISGSAGLVWEDVPEPQMVDLGLPSGKKWANINLGAAVPTDFGAYYAWGELYPKVTFWWTTYKWGNAAQEKVTKYCPSTRPQRWVGNGEPDNIRELVAADDAAIACWGEGWTMPSPADCNELAERCKWSWYDDYEDTGVSGFRVEGAGDAFIFLPAGGYLYDFGCPTQGNLHGYYWTTMLYDNPTSARTFEFYDGISGGKGNTDQSLSRLNGALIRPVWKATN